MRDRRSHYDVTNRILISDPRAVRDTVSDIVATAYPACDLAPLHHAFETFGKLYSGVLAGFHGCDTWYHDAQHSLDCTLAMARLLDGHEKSEPPADRLGERRVVLGLICALFHDSGYIRRDDESQIHNGAEFTLYHVRRSGDFLADYLPMVGFGDVASLAQQLVHFTGYEMALDAIPVRERKDRKLGFLLGTADILAQMADRCYLEKCRSFLYHEFEACGLAGAPRRGGPRPLYSSADDLTRKTPEFVRKLFEERLDGYFQGAYRYVERHFNGANPYLQEIQNHLTYLKMILASGSLAGLHRRPRSINARVLRRILGIRLAQDREHGAARRRRPRFRPAPTIDPEQYVPT